jgi:hypothetical protein
MATKPKTNTTKAKPPVPKHIFRPFSRTNDKPGNLPEPARSLGIVSGTGELRLIFDYLILGVPILRQGEQIVIDAGSHIITIRIDTEVAEAKGWRIEEVEDGLHGKYITWLRHDPESGMSIRAQEKEE